MIRRTLFPMAMSVFIAAPCAQAKNATPSPSDSLEPTNSHCAKPIHGMAYNAYIDSTIPSDVDPSLIIPPTPTTRVYFSVLVPEHCAGQTFPVVYNQSAWGERRVEHLALINDPFERGPAILSETEFVKQLPAYGYVVISVDPRGINDSIPANGSGPQRLIDPNVEVQDARQIIDWAYDHAAEYAIQTEPHSGIAKDIKIGTYGLSYGGGFQMSLAALDQRIDTIIPNQTWNDVMYSIVPGGAIKFGWGGLLCAAGQVRHQVYTPTLGALCRLIGITDPKAGGMRTLTDLAGFVGDLPGQTPNEEQLQRQQALQSEFGVNAFPSLDSIIEFLEHPGMGYFASQQAANQRWGFGENRSRLRPVPALFVQSNSDLLFNLTEGYWNWRYFTDAGGDTRLISINGGHNALASPETAYCGQINAMQAALDWFAHYLQNAPASRIANLPTVCISVSDTLGAPRVENVGVALSRFPVGSLSGPGAIPASLDSITAEVDAFQQSATFIPITTIDVEGAVLAGAPSIGHLTVSPKGGTAATAQVAAYIGTGIRRNGSLIIVDQQVTGFAQGEHDRTDQYIHQEDRILLPAVGERLLPGDEVGLLLLPQHYSFSPLTSLQTLTDVPLLLGQVSGIRLGENLLQAAEKVNGLTDINPYTVRMQQIGLPILIPGSYPGSH